MRVAYADPPYPGQSEAHYGDHPDFAGEVDHADLIDHLEADFDAWVLHTAVNTLPDILKLCPPLGQDCRLAAWVKPFAGFKRNVSPAYAWEPVIFRNPRHATPNRIEGLVMRDFIAEGITLQKGLSGVKPEKVCWWCFECMGLEPDDELHDLFPGSGAVSRAWDGWRARISALGPDPEQMGLEAA